MNSNIHFVFTYTCTFAHLCTCASMHQCLPCGLPRSGVLIARTPSPPRTLPASNIRVHTCVQNVKSECTVVRQVLAWVDAGLFGFGTQVCMCALHLALCAQLCTPPLIYIYIILLCYILCVLLTYSSALSCSLLALYSLLLHSFLLSRTLW